MEMLLPPQEVIETNMSCQYCNRTYGNIHGKIMHENVCLLNSTNPREDRYICNNCFLSFKYEARLRYHKKYDCGRAHRCQNCYKVFTERLSLKRHIKHNICTKKKHFMHY